MIKQNIWGLQYIDELIATVNNPEFMSNQTFDHEFDIDAAKIYMAAHDSLFNVMGIFEFSRMLGDLNNDGWVFGGSDYGVFYPNLNQTTTEGPAVGDFNEDGVVDMVDSALVYFGYSDYTPRRSTPVERYEYTPYGERQVYISAGTDDPKAMSPVSRSQRVLESGLETAVALCEIGFQGLVHDEVTGLIQQRNRMNHARLGRFMQRDPLGYVDGMSVYAGYFVMYGGWDPWGLMGMPGLPGSPNDPSHPFNPNPGESDVISKGDFTISVSDYVDNAASGTLYVGYELSRTGQLRLDYSRMASEIAGMGLSKAEESALRDSIKMHFREVQTELGKRMTEEILKRRKAAGHVRTTHNPGSTNVKVNSQAKLFRHMVRSVMVGSIAINIYIVIQEDPEDRPRAIAEGGGGIVGGIGGGIVGGGAGGSIGGPPGVIIGGIIGGIAGGLGGEATVSFLCDNHEDGRMPDPSKPSVPGIENPGLYPP